VIKAGAKCGFFYFRTKTRWRTSFSLGLRAEQFVVDSAKDGIAGYYMAALQSYDLLIVDLALPRLGGKDR